jgi:hypothetical protein
MGDLMDEDEFGDCSFLQDIADVDENGRVIMAGVATNSRIDDSSQRELCMVDEFGDYAWMAHLEIDENGNVIGGGSDDNNGQKVRTENIMPAYCSQEESKLDCHGDKERQRAEFCDLKVSPLKRPGNGDIFNNNNSNNSPASVIINPYSSPQKKKQGNSTPSHKIPPHTPGSTAGDGQKRRQPERFIVHV